LKNKRYKKNKVRKNRFTTEEILCIIPICRPKAGKEEKVPD
jgi:hypothetical protein